MIGGRHDRLDTSLMKAAPGRLISKAGMEALRAIAILPGVRDGSSSTEPTGLAIKIEDGDGYDRGHLGGIGRGAPAGGRARRRGDARPRPIPPAR